MHTIIEISAMILLTCITFDSTFGKDEICTRIDSLKMVTCTGKDKLLPNDLVFQKFPTKYELRIHDIKQEIELRLPGEYRKKEGKEFAYYDKFIFKNICLKSIEDRFFLIFNEYQDYMIFKFTNVSCLKTLRKASFDGIENRIKSFVLKQLNDLQRIESNFFDNFDKLESLEITHTKIETINVNLLEIQTLKSLNLRNNQIKTLDQRFVIKSNFKFSLNPFQCNCLLSGFIDRNRQVLNNNYRCSNGSLLKTMGDLCLVPSSTVSKIPNVTTNKLTISTTSNVQIKQNDQSKKTLSGSQRKQVIGKGSGQQIQESAIKLEVIIPTIIVIVAVLVVLIVLVVMKRRKDLKENKYRNVQTNSPSVPYTEHKKVLMDSQI